MRLALVFDFLKVEAQSPDDFSPIPVVELLPKFIESKVDYVVMMDLLRGNVATKFKPNTVQQISLFGREVRRMGTQIENVLLAARGVNLEGQLGFGIG